MVKQRISTDIEALKIIQDKEYEALKVIKQNVKNLQMAVFAIFWTLEVL